MILSRKENKKKFSMYLCPNFNDNSRNKFYAIFMLSLNRRSGIYGGGIQKTLDTLNLFN